MCPTKLRKTRKMRGKRTVGWGQIGQHRKHGERGGRKVGRHKHLWSYTLRYMPNYFGKRGFKTPQSIKGTNKPTTINIGQLDQLTDKLSTQPTPKATGTKRTTRSKAMTIDLTALGIQKLLATGHTSKPLTIKVQSYSEAALKKIEEAGGKIITPQPEQPQEPENKQPEEATEQPTKP